YGGGKYDFRSRSENGKFKFAFSEAGDNSIHEEPIFEDRVANVRTCFLELPIEYIHHDELINPRGINSSISKLVKEFAKRNPQLHLSLARLDDDKIKIFDGQHK